jgi:hypothetical protein
MSRFEEFLIELSILYEAFEMPAEQKMQGCPDNFFRGR